jgi:pyruvate kinase
MRKTKIIATLGPATSSPSSLEALLTAGVNVVRINCSHARPDWIRRTVPEVRAIARRLGVPVGVLLDTQGPSIRTGDLAAPIPLAVGDTFVFTIAGETAEGVKTTSVSYADFPRDVEVGRTLLVDNGGIAMRIRSKTETRVECEVLTEGAMGSRRHINLPGVRLSLPALTPKDREDVALGLELGVDFVAQSFVRDPADVAALRDLTAAARHPVQLVAKVEHQFAVDHFEDIAANADAIMVARGDLGIECPYEELPIIQRRIVKHCLKIGRPVIVATQMLESMTENPFPTRAEITDVANAVFEQADAIMLSGETAAGRYPVECVRVMDRIAQRIERSGGANYHEAAEMANAREMLVRSAVMLADQLKAAALVVFTRDGRIARDAAWLRPRVSPIFVFSARDSLLGTLSLLRGVCPIAMPACEDDPAGSVEGAIGRLRALGRVRTGDRVVVVLPHRSSDDNEVEAVKMLVIQ